MKLKKSFYNQPPEILAPMLLGKTLYRNYNGQVLSSIITQTEAYSGALDTASHAKNGKTSRNSPMFMSGGIAYIYLCYGIHNLFNVVAGEEGVAGAVLIRETQTFRGPGIMTKALKIDRSLNEIDLCTSNILWIEDDGQTTKYITAPRVGIDYASDEDKIRPWRFIMIN